MSALPNNVELLEECIHDHPEPIADPAYAKDFQIITADPKKNNSLMTANRELLDCITAYGKVMKLQEMAAADKIITEMMRLLETPGMNNSEFTSFWECRDVSFSLYQKGLSAKEKRKFLHDVSAVYLSDRHAMYQAHGYTATSLQVKADSFAHKRTGEQGGAKMRDIFHSLKLSLVGNLGEDDGFLFTDKKGKSAFQAWVKGAKVGFLWSQNHKGKMPDAGIQIGKLFFVVEHKHMKETGGGQDKQIVEISEFVAQQEMVPHVHYVAFLDGILFNQLFSPLATSKLAVQKNAIYAALRANPSNYFVNTWGFKQLMQAAIKAK